MMDVSILPVAAATMITVNSTRTRNGLRNIQSISLSIDLRALLSVLVDPDHANAGLVSHLRVARRVLKNCIRTRAHTVSPCYPKVEARTSL